MGMRTSVRRRVARCPFPCARGALRIGIAADVPKSTFLYPQLRDSGPLGYLDMLNTGLLDSDLAVETARDLVDLAARLHPGASPSELGDLAMAALGSLAPAAPDAWLAMAGLASLTPGTPDAWLAAAVERAAEQLQW